MQPGRPLVNVEPQKGASIQFVENNDYRLPQTDFDNCEFSGHLVQPSTPFSGNFRSCSLQNLHCDRMSFSGADLLDCQITASTFSGCDFDTSHMAGCILRNVVMSGVRISNINFSQNVFQNVVFENCEFDTFVFKNSRFYNCQFQNCITKNHTFDTCFFDEVRLFGLNVFPSTILMNVGLRIEDIERAAYFSDRENMGGLRIDEATYLAQVQQMSSGIQEKISVAVFSSRNGDELVEEVTAVLSTKDHVSRAVSRGFIEKLDLLVTLLNLYYQENRLIALNLLQMQDYLNALSEQLFGHSDKLTSQFKSQIDALRFANSEYVAEVIQVLNFANSSFEGARFIALLGEERQSLEGFQRLLKDHQGVSVLEVRERQSPVAIFTELFEVGALVWIISAVVTTRFRYQLLEPDIITDEQDEALAKLDKQLPESKASRAELSAPKRTERHLEVGLLSRETMDVGLRISNAFQGGIVKKFELSFSPKRAVEFQKNLLGLIGSYTRTGN